MKILAVLTIVNAVLTVVGTAWLEMRKQDPKWTNLIVAGMIGLVFGGGIPYAGVWKRNNICLVVWVGLLILGAVLCMMGAFVVLIHGQMPVPNQPGVYRKSTAGVIVSVILIVALTAAIFTYFAWVVNVWRKSIQRK